jgi:simple sugar transport system substrate-binding protein
VDADQLTKTAAAVDRETLLRRIAAGGAALSLPALVAARDAAAEPSGAAAGGGGFYPNHPRWRFAFVNPLTEDSLFVPTAYGASDACGLVQCAFTWSGSTTGNVREQVNAFDAALATKADGIAVAVTHATAFEAPIKRALAKGVPVVSYYADGARGGAKARMAFTGTDAYASGLAMGERIAALVTKGDVALFVATPGAVAVQPRIDGAVAGITQSRKPINPRVVATDADPATALEAIDSYYLAHKSVAGMVGVDAVDTEAVGQIVQKYRIGARVAAGGYDLLGKTPALVSQGALDFAIDQERYLQGLYPVLQLFLYKLSGGLLTPSDTDTGPRFVTKANVGAYVKTTTRYEGTSKAQKYPIS